jgi:hypothetical protein
MLALIFLLRKILVLLVLCAVKLHCKICFLFFFVFFFLRGSFIVRLKECKSVNTV